MPAVCLSIAKIFERLLKRPAQRAFFLSIIFVTLAGL